MALGPRRARHALAAWQGSQGRAGQWGSDTGGRADKGRAVRLVRRAGQSGAVRGS